MKQLNRQSLDTRLKPNLAYEFETWPHTGTLKRPLGNRLLRLYRLPVEEYLTAIVKESEQGKCRSLLGGLVDYEWSKYDVILRVVFDVFTKKENSEIDDELRTLDRMMSCPSEKESNPTASSFDIAKAAEFLQLLFVEPLAKTYQEKR